MLAYLSLQGALSLPLLTTQLQIKGQTEHSRIHETKEHMFTSIGICIDVFWYIHIYICALTHVHIHKKWMCVAVTHNDRAGRKPE